MTTAEKHRVVEANAAQFLKWMRERGGIAVWGCLDLGNPGRTWSTPLNNEDGTPKTKPHWSATTEPIRVITSMTDVLVDTPREVKRFHVAVRRGDTLSFVLTAGSTKKVRKAVDSAGSDAWYEFDYMSQEAVILVPNESITLLEWANRYGK